MSQSGSGIVEGILVSLCDVFVAGDACLQIARGPFDHSLMSPCLILGLLISFMTECTPFGKMGVFAEQAFIHQEPLIQLVRLNWRRGSGSPFSFFSADFRRLEKGS